MRFLIVAASVLACAVSAPSGLLGYGYAGVAHSGPLLAHSGPLLAHSGPLLAHSGPLLAHAGPVLAHAAVPTISPGDLQGAAIDAHVDASDHARAAVDAAREAHDQHAELHGQAVNAAEDHSWQALDAANTQQAQLDGAAAGVAPVLAKQLAGHVAYAAPALPYAAPHLSAAHTVVSQSLSQSHPAPLVHAPLVYGHGLAHRW